MDSKGAGCPVNALPIALNVPESFQPKAKFALKALLGPLKIPFEWISLEELKVRGGLYYGIPHELQSSAKPIIALWVADATLSFFEQTLPISSLKAGMFRYKEDELPVLFGQPTNHQLNEHVAVYEADVIASAFFWLSDWENLHRTDLDAHGRALYQGSLQQQWGLAYRCVVDDYRAVLYAWLCMHLSLNAPPSATRWSTMFTHDIDRIKKRTPGMIYREVWLYWIKNIAKKSFYLRTKRLGQSIRQFIQHDAYKDSLLSLVRTEHLHRISGTFLFKSILQKHQHDAGNYLEDAFFKKWLQWLTALHHEIGYHSGFLAGYRAETLVREHTQLVKKTGLTPVMHRSHYLRYDASILFKTLVSLGYHFDSSIAWADHVGSRTQTCHPHPVFDIYQNKELPLLEVPLMVMDTQLMGYMKRDPEQAISCIEQCVNLVKRHHGVMVWNFHHHCYDPIDAPGWDRLLSYAFECTKDAQSIRCADIDRESVLNA